VAEINPKHNRKKKKEKRKKKDLLDHLPAEGDTDQELA